MSSTLISSMPRNPRDVIRVSKNPSARPYLVRVAKALSAWPPLKASMASDMGFGCLAPGASSLARRSPARPQSRVLRECLYRLPFNSPSHQMGHLQFMHALPFAGSHLPFFLFFARPGQVFRCRRYRLSMFLTPSRASSPPSSPSPTEPLPLSGQSPSAFQGLVFSFVPLRPACREQPPQI